MQPIRFMRKLFFSLLLAFPLALCAQQPITQEGEFGVGIGAGHYFGDLNTRARLNRLKPSAGLFFRKNFNNYVALRIGASYTQLGYSDVYNTHNELMRRRNLSFNTNVWELGLQGDFNFYRFMPGEEGFNFTPYVTIGASVFNYDPYAFLGGEKYFLRPLGTEGQNDTSYNLRPYSSMALAVPFGVGLKYALNRRINLGAEIVYRFANTDYLDDVSGTYAGAEAFPPNPDGTPNPALLLSDRSYETGPLLGVKGRQRGNSQNKDAFVTALFYISFNLQSYKCPTVN